MTAPPPPVLEMVDVERRYQGLRPLRLQALTVSPGERVAIVGLDAGGAETLVNLVTGASVPDRGTVRVLGRSTAEIVDGDDWLASLDRFGMVSPRAVLLEGATLEQNLAMPFTLQIDPLTPEMAARVTSLAIECGLVAEEAESVGRMKLSAAALSPELRARAHLARAIALEPSLLILEHPGAEISDAARADLARVVTRVTDARKMAALVLTQDAAFANAVAHRTLKLTPATGALTPLRRGWFR